VAVKYGEISLPCKRLLLRAAFVKTNNNTLNADIISENAENSEHQKASAH
jgi:hypothetical protein